MDSSLIETTHLTKRFGTFTAVENLSITVSKGEIYGFLGLNGAGKTTTIRMLLGLISPSSGTARIQGESIRRGGRGPWHLVGSLVEIPYSYPELTVRENLDIARRMRKLADPRSIDLVMDKLKIARYAQRQAGKLSSGNLQRLGLAKALIHNPPILILDEPSNSLDPAGIVETRELLKELARELSVTIFVSSHLLDEIARLATRIGIIHNGKLVRELDVNELHDIRRRHLCILTREPGRAQSLLADAGHLISKEDGETLWLNDDPAILRPDEIAALLVRAGIPLTGLMVHEESLEDFFLRMIGEKK